MDRIGRCQEDAGDLLAPGRPVSPSLPSETLIVFDWDDTILPTSWLERNHALHANVPMRPELQRQIGYLCTACSQTLISASQLGKIVIVTNSAPGWVDQSCRLFMPQIFHQVSNLQVFAKPMGAPLTFKTGIFKREGKAFKNVVSIGDGDAERTACQRLQTPPGRKGIGCELGETMPSRVKSVKLEEMPSCARLIAQQEMVLSRLPDVVAFKGSLDLKSRFSAQGFGVARGDDLTACQLVHLTKPMADDIVTPRQEPASEDAGTSASAKMQSFLMPLSPPKASFNPSRDRISQLPALSVGGPGSDRTQAAPQLVVTGQADNELFSTAPWKMQGDAISIRSQYQGLGNKKKGVPASPLSRNLGPLAGRSSQAVRP
jgi:hypothetical protein